MAKRVLLISYFFPPSSSVGGKRPASFYRHLPTFDWQPHVLTIYPVEGHRLTNDWPNVTRTTYISPWKWLERQRATSTVASSHSSSNTLRQIVMKSTWQQKLYFWLRHILPMSSVRMPDATLGWYPFAIQAGKKLLQQYKFDVIWSTTGPPTNHLVGAWLHQWSGLPWIVDYRDLWSLNYQETRLPVFQFFEKEMEQQIVASATQMTTISEGLAKILADFHHQPVKVVYNGFNKEITSLLPLPSHQNFIIRYTGSLYPGKQDVTAFFQGLVQARTVEPTFCPQIEFVGPELNWIIDLAATYGLTNIVKYQPPVSPQEANILQQTATVLLLFGWLDLNHQPGVLPVKMFDYLQTGRPILEVGSPEAESAKIIAQCGSGVTVKHPSEIQKVLLKWWQEFQQTGYVIGSPNLNQVTQYSRQIQTAQLAKILDTVSQY